MSKWLIATGLLATLTMIGACSSASVDRPRSVTTTTVTAYESARSTQSTSAPADSSAPQALRSDWDAVSRTLAQPVGIAIAAVGTGRSTPIVLGDEQVQVAWSTIKVPLAVAAERHHGGPLTATTAAITQSDNAAAQSLWDSLGTDAQAAAAVMKVLTEGANGDVSVPTTQLRAGYTIFGQTRWSLPQAATFTAHLPCLRGSDRVVGLMGRVAANQRWGVEVMKTPTATAVKGGWGPGAVSGYVVRQLGLITHRDGARTAVAMTTYSPDGSLGSGMTALNQTAQWLNRKLAVVPRGRC